MHVPSGMTAPNSPSQKPADPTHPGELLGELLVSQGLITREQLAQGLHEQRTTHQRLGLILARGKGPRFPSSS